MEDANPLQLHKIPCLSDANLTTQTFPSQKRDLQPEMSSDVAHSTRLHNICTGDWPVARIRQQQKPDLEPSVAVKTVRLSSVAFILLTLAASPSFPEGVGIHLVAEVYFKDPEFPRLFRNHQRMPLPLSGHEEGCVFGRLKLLQPASQTGC